MGKAIVYALLIGLVKAVAPIVCLVYRGGWFLTPDDPVSPFGCGTTPGASREPAMQRMYERFGRFIADWWWLGVRNRAYGLAYALKPEHFKAMTSYATDVRSWSYRWHGPLRRIEIDGFVEWTLDAKVAHVILGWRLRPVWDGLLVDVPVRPVNMDARPILSVRAGGADD
jgi:hypothetical protein